MQVHSICSVDVVEAIGFETGAQSAGGSRPTKVPGNSLTCECGRDMAVPNSHFVGTPNMCVTGNGFAGEPSMAELNAFRVNPRRSESGGAAFDACRPAVVYLDRKLRCNDRCERDDAVQEERCQWRSSRDSDHRAVFWTSGQANNSARGSNVKRFRFQKLDSTTLKSAETTKIVDGKVKVGPRLRVTRTKGRLFELLIPGLSLSGAVTVVSFDNIPIPDGQKLLGADDPMAH